MSDLRGTTTSERAEMGNTGKIVGAAVVALAVCAGGAYLYAAGTGKSAPHRQVVASNGFSSPALPAAATPAVAPQQPTVAPPPAPDNSTAQSMQNGPLQASPAAKPAQPVKTARIHTTKYTTPPSQVAPMPDNNATPATPPSAPPASSLSEQPAPAVNTTPSVPTQETPAQNIPQQPAQGSDQPNSAQQNTSAPQPQ